MGERASKTREVQSLVNPDIPASPAARHALEIETTDWNGQFFDRQKFWRRRLPLYFMTCIILTKDVVTFGSFKSIDGDKHEIEFRLAKQLYTCMRLFKWRFRCCQRRDCSKSLRVGYTWELLVEVCRPVLQILTLFQTKNVIFYTRFQTWPLRIFFIIT